jgi:class 3 adenylate cyclase
MAAFRTADSALQFALAFRANTGDSRIAVRAGIHLGQVRIKDNDIYGLMVNYAARLAHIKLRGDEGIFLSAAAKRDIDSEYGATQKDFSLTRLLATQLPGFSAREEVWRVETAEIRAARIARIRAKRTEETEKNLIPMVPVPQVAEVRLPDPPRPLSDFARRLIIGPPITGPSKKN